MGPLVPEIVSNEFNLILAGLIGFFFGFILEQAGFSSTRKLVGLFYGYDFTVLRVFFTAGVTAMTGVLLLSHYELLDLSVIFVNPTFLRSALTGGVIMGAGFVLGGFCPGTSVCAAAIGRIDAMIFVAGSFLGVFAFSSVYPMVEEFYLADAMGPVRMNEILGISMPLFAFLVVVIALTAFLVTWKIEKSIQKRSYRMPRNVKIKYALAAAVPFVGIAVVSFLPGRQEIIAHRIAEAQRQKKCIFYEISADKLASELTTRHYEIQVIDVRSPEEYEKYHLPLAINIPFEEITDRKWEGVFRQNMKTNVFYADNDTLVRMSCLKAKFVGNSKNLILSESTAQFRKMFFELQTPAATASRKELDEYHFRSRAAAEMQSLSEALKNLGKPVVKEVKVAAGGCS